MNGELSASDAIFLPPGGGREYQAGPMRAVFEADGDETQDAYCVSEWWLEAATRGPVRIPTRTTWSCSTS